MTRCKESVDCSLTFHCPGCGGVVSGSSAGAFVCAGCSRHFPVFGGIPDFRLFDPPYASREEDIIKAQNLLSQYDQMDYAAMVHLAQGTADLPMDLREKFTNYRLNAVQRGGDRVRTIRWLLGLNGKTLSRTRCALVVGCGSGAALVALSSLFRVVVGMDICLEELVLARKLVEEHDIENARLVCACAEALPFSPRTFDLVIADDVIEHLRFQREAIMACCDVLSDRGFFSFNSGNRFDPFHPEPHVDLWGVGFFPRPLQPVYVKLLRGMEYKGKRILSWPELERLGGVVRGHGYQFNMTYLPRIVDPAQPGRTWKGRLVRKVPPVVFVADLLSKFFATAYEVIIWRHHEV